MASATDEVQPGPLLVQSKLQPPAARQLVSRPELVERLAGGPARRVTLISARAGWGKTTLLSAWVASRRSGDRSPGSRWTRAMARASASGPTW